MTHLVLRFAQNHTGASLNQTVCPLILGVSGLLWISLIDMALLMKGYVMFEVMCASIFKCAIFVWQAVRAVYHRRNSETVQGMSNMVELAQCQIRKYLLPLKVRLIYYRGIFLDPNHNSEVLCKYFNSVNEIEVKSAVWAWKVFPRKCCMSNIILHVSPKFVAIIMCLTK